MSVCEAISRLRVDKSRRDPADARIAPIKVAAHRSSHTSPTTTRHDLSCSAARKSSTATSDSLATTCSPDKAAAKSHNRCFTSQVAVSFDSPTQYEPSRKRFRPPVSPTTQLATSRQERVFPTPPCPCAPIAAQDFEMDWMRALYSRAAGSPESLQRLKMLGRSEDRSFRTGRIAVARSEVASTASRVSSATATLRR